MDARLAAAEAGLRETITALDVALRVRAQEAVGQAQPAVSAFGEKVHLLEVARRLSGDTGTANSPDGRWGSPDCAGLEAVAFRERLNELELRVRAAKTAAEEQK